MPLANFVDLNKIATFVSIYIVAYDVIHLAHVEAGRFLHVNVFQTWPANVPELIMHPLQFSS